MSDPGAEIRRGERFAFGGNWGRFLDLVDETRIGRAERSLEAWLGSGSLRGARFLDAGCGSGLFSLAARRLGAEVVSFDFDPACVACAVELRSRFLPGDDGWEIDRGSVLDAEFLARLGDFGIVYSWGVLHHTGRMWEAIERVSERTERGGRLWIALYNDQGGWSRGWLAIKRAYNRSPRFLRGPITAACFARLWGPTLLRDGLRGDPLRTWNAYGANERGMSPWRDVVDWVGGLPFEVASPERVIGFLAARGFDAERRTTQGRGHGCNEFLLRRR